MGRAQASLFILRMSTLEEKLEEAERRAADAERRATNRARAEKKLPRACNKTTRRRVWHRDETSIVSLNRVVMEREEDEIAQS